MNAIKNRIKKLEAKAKAVKLFKGDIAPWAFKYAKETMETAEKSLECRFRRAYEAGRISVPLKFSVPESAIKRQAKYYTETYQNLQACIEGENRKREELKALLKPGLIALENAIERYHKKRRAL